LIQQELARAKSTLEDGLTRCWDECTAFRCSKFDQKFYKKIIATIRSVMLRTSVYTATTVLKRMRSNACHRGWSWRRVTSRRQLAIASHRQQRQSLVTPALPSISLRQ